MVLKKERLRIECLANKTTFIVLKLFIEKPYSAFSLSEISRETGISKSNVLRALRTLGPVGIIREVKGGSRKLIKTDPGSGIGLAFADLFMQERIANMKPKTKNAVGYLFSKIKDGIDGFILFGSCTYGLETGESDIDILVIGRERATISSAEFLPYRFEIHSKTWNEIEQLDDFVVLEAVLNGIYFKGCKRLFSIKAGIESFPKDYILFRLKKAKEYEERIQKTSGEAKKYYKELLRVALGEMEALLFEGRIVPKKNANPKRDIEEIEEKLSKEGEKVWLTKT